MIGKAFALDSFSVGRALRKRINKNGAALKASAVAASMVRP